MTLDPLIQWNKSLKGRAVTTFAALGICLALYHLLNATLTPRIDWFYTSWDSMIPWLPWTLPIYFSMYLQCLVAAFRAPANQYVQALFALLIATVTSCIIFVLLPAHYPRPNPATLDSAFWQQVFTHVYQSDGAGNTFPSIHVSATTLLARAMWQDRYRALWIIWSAAIAISILTVKQHFIVDLLGGLVVAALSWTIADKLFTRHQRAKTA